jgi:hypothetical protein
MVDTLRVYIDCVADGHAMSDIHPTLWLCDDLNEMEIDM